MIKNPIQWFHNLPEGMRTFVIIWFGGLVSLTGTSMTSFALITWAYSITGQATTLALLLFAGRILQVIVSPFAGVVVDRYDRRLIMFYSDLGSGILTSLVLILYVNGSLEIWHLYGVQALNGILSAFQRPAYTASISLMVPRKHLSRANGMRSLAVEGSSILAPFLAGVLIVTLGMASVMIVDIITFLIAAYTLYIVRIPQPRASPSAENDAPALTFWQQVTYGFGYIFQRRGLMWLMFIFMGVNFTAALTYFGILPAMILARSGNNELALATVQSMMGIGGVIGAIFISTWGGPKRLIHGALGFTAFSFILGDFIIGTGQSTAQWAIGGFLAAVFIPTLVASERAIWQRKVAPEVQGRVFAVHTLFREGLYPLGYLLAGPLADQVFGPAMMPGGALADSFGWLVGTGAGAGMGLMFVCTAFIGLTISLGGYLIPSLRNVEEDLPDYEIVEMEAVPVVPVIGD
ncbi:MAG: MFS transporter [Aggregatilineales bacterium]